MLNLLIGLSLPNLAAVTKAAFKALNTLAVAPQQPTKGGPLAETPSHSVRILGQVSGQGSLKGLVPREPVPDRGCALLDHGVDAVPVVLPGADLKSEYSVKQYTCHRTFNCPEQPSALRVNT